jgi:hypothetical protein
VAAAEQGCEQRAKVTVHELEGVQQALTAIHVQRVDAFAELGNGGSEVIALLDLETHALRYLAKLFVSLHIHRAELVTLAAQLAEARVQNVGVGAGFFRLRRISIAVLCACGA